MSKDSGGKTQKTENTPWAPQGDQLENIFGQAQGVYNSGGFGAVAPQSDWTQQAQQQIADFASGGGSGVMGNASNMANATLGGEYMPGSNPYFQDAIAYGQQPVIDQFKKQVMPSIDAAFSRAGGLNSGAYRNEQESAIDILARNLGGAATQAAAAEYGNERGRQMQTMQNAPGLAQGAYGDLAQLGNMGAARDAYQQSLATQDARNLQGYSNIIGGMPTFGTATQTSQNTGGNAFGQMLGLAATGASLAGGLGWAPFAAPAADVLLGGGGGGLLQPSFGGFGAGSGLTL